MFARIYSGAVSTCRRVSGELAEHVPRAGARGALVAQSSVAAACAIRVRTGHTRPARAQLSHARQRRARRLIGRAACTRACQQLRGHRSRREGCALWAFSLNSSDQWPLATRVLVFMCGE